MTLDENLKLSQIIFYITASIVAILTYIKAKNGLLNAVNTEYKKRVMDRLAEVSRVLIAEYDPLSPQHWSRIDSVKEVLAQLHEEILPNKDEILKTGKMWSGIPVSKKEQDLYRNVDIFRSDPFIPRSIRDSLVDFFQNRAEVMSAIYIEEISAYQKGLAKGKYWDTLADNYNWLHNRILDKLYARGCGIPQIETEIHALRDQIQNYLEQFDPIKKV